MITFWIPVAIGTVLVLAWMLLPLLRGGAGRGKTRAAYDVQVFKDQLAEVDSDLARGVLEESEATRLRTEVSRRLLAAADAQAGQTGAVGAPRSASLALMGLMTLAIVGGGYGLYQTLGQPGMQDFPFSANLARQNYRPHQDEIEAMVAEQEANGELATPELSPRAQEALTLIGQLQLALESRPDDLEGRRILVNELGRVGKMAEARKVQEQIMALLGDTATAQDYVDLAELMILAGNGYVSPEAFDALNGAYQLDPQNQRMLFYIGHALVQEGDYRRAYNIWADLLANSPADAPWVAPIQAQIDVLAQAAGVGPALRGPGAADVEAAGQMTEEERNAQIATMVAGAEERLLSEGGDVAEWARLITALGVLNEPERAMTAWQAAQAAFAADPDALAQVNQAAAQAGLSAE